MEQKENLIKTEKIKYSYPVSEEIDEFAGPEVKSKDIRNALEGVDLEISKGQFICILGSNGSGKSTLARHMNALLIPDEGTVWVDDLNTSDDNNVWEIRSRVGMVFQNPDNQMVASQVDEEIAFGPENLGVEPSIIRKRVKDALKTVGLERFDHENPTALSGGQKQRVAIASVLSMKPECIVLDESTSMLDPRGRKEIMDTVLRLNKEEGLTIICITHYMEEAVNADRVFVMKDGHLMMAGTPVEIFSRYEEAESAGLKLPVICQLAHKLRERGMDIPRSILTAEELRAAVLRAGGR